MKSWMSFFLIFIAGSGFCFDYKGDGAYKKSEGAGAWSYRVWVPIDLTEFEAIIGELPKPQEIHRIGLVLKQRESCKGKSIVAVADQIQGYRYSIFLYRQNYKEPYFSVNTPLLVSGTDEDGSYFREGYARFLTASEVKWWLTNANHDAFQVWPKLGLLGHFGLGNTESQKIKIVMEDEALQLINDSCFELNILVEASGWQ